MPQQQRQQQQQQQSQATKTLDFRTNDQKTQAASGNKVALKNEKGLLMSGKGAKKAGPTGDGNAAVAVGAAVGVGAVGAGVAAGISNPGAVEAIASGAGHAVGAAANFIGGLFK